jgi:hypothetical protein
VNVPVVGASRRGSGQSLDRTQVSAPNKAPRPTAVASGTMTPSTRTRLPCLGPCLTRTRSRTASSPSRGPASCARAYLSSTRPPTVGTKAGSANNPHGGPDPSHPGQPAACLSPPSGFPPSNGRADGGRRPFRAPLTCRPPDAEQRPTHQTRTRTPRPVDITVSAQFVPPRLAFNSRAQEPRLKIV